MFPGGQDLAFRYGVGCEGCEAEFGPTLAFGGFGVKSMELFYEKKKKKEIPQTKIKGLLNVCMFKAKFAWLDGNFGCFGWIFLHGAAQSLLHRAILHPKTYFWGYFTMVWPKQHHGVSMFLRFFPLFFFTPRKTRPWFSWFSRWFHPLACRQLFDLLDRTGDSVGGPKSRCRCLFRVCFGVFVVGLLTFLKNKTKNGGVCLFFAGGILVFFK